MVVVYARDFLTSGASLMDAAMACSSRIASLIASGSDVVLAFDGFRGASSSFFNAFWLTLIDFAGSETIGRLRIDTKSRVLADLIERSRLAAIDRYRAESGTDGAQGYPMRKTMAPAN